MIMKIVLKTPYMLGKQEICAKNLTILVLSGYAVIVPIKRNNLLSIWFIFMEPFHKTVLLSPSRRAGKQSSTGCFPALLYLKRYSKHLVFWGKQESCPKNLTILMLVGYTIIVPIKRNEPPFYSVFYLRNLSIRRSSFLPSRRAGK